MKATRDERRGSRRTGRRPRSHGINLLVRADGSPAVGTGHALRCLALAQACIDRGGTAAFATPEPESPLFARLGAADPLEIVALPAGPSLEADADATASAARARHADWVVLDGYRFDLGYRRRIRSAGLRLMALDDFDLAERRQADLILNQNLHAVAAARQGTRNGRQRLLLGPSYALLRREFAGWLHRRRRIPERATRILLSLGGGDVGTALARVLASIAALERPELSVRCLVGPLGSATPALERLAEEAACEVSLQTAPTEMPELMAWADLAVSGGGSTCWELMFMGLPALLVAHNAHQERIAGSVAEAGAALYAGSVGAISRPQLTALLARVLDDADRRRAMSARGRALVDGRGAQRVILELEDRLSSEG